MARIRAGEIKFPKKSFWSRGNKPEEMKVNGELVAENEWTAFIILKIRRASCFFYNTHTRNNLY